MREFWGLAFETFPQLCPCLPPSPDPDNLLMLHERFPELEEVLRPLHGNVEVDRALVAQVGVSKVPSMADCA